jgi:hypothetical protein
VFRNNLRLWKSYFTSKMAHNLSLWHLKIENITV